MAKNKKIHTDDSFWGYIKEILETIFTVLILVILIRHFIGEPRWIPSESMLPTLQVGDRLIIEKVSSFFTSPERGDILVFYPPCNKLKEGYLASVTRLIGFFNTDDAYIKRVIGVPGDKITIKNGWISDGAGIYINGKKMIEPYTMQDNYVTCTKSMNCGPMVVPEHSYFMMGDNRNNSQDSRYWGFLPQERIIGKAYFMFWPINRMGLIEKPNYSIKEKRQPEKTKLGEVYDNSVEYLFGITASFSQKAPAK